MRSIILVRDLVLVAASWPPREAFAVALRVAVVSFCSTSMSFWTVLKFLRRSSWGRRRRG